MKKIKINTTKDFQVGNVRLCEKTYRKVEKLAEENGVSNQTIVREILDNFIDEVIFE